MRDIQLVLERWGEWAKDNSNVGWSPVAAGFKGLLPDNSKNKSSCCDDDGIFVDSAVGKLKQVGRHDELNLIFLHYVFDLNKYEIARRFKCSEGKIRSKLLIAETFIDGCLIMAGIKLEMDDWTHKSETQIN